VTSKETLKRLAVPIGRERRRSKGGSMSTNDNDASASRTVRRRDWLSTAAVTPAAGALLPVICRKRAGSRGARTACLDGQALN